MVFRKGRRGILVQIKFRCFRTGVLCALVASVCARGTNAGDTVAGGPALLTVLNSGFEADLVNAGCFGLFQPADWVAYDPNGLLNGGGNSIGGLNLPVGSVFFPDGAPEGDHVGLVFLQDTIGGGPAGLSQVLAETLQANTTYTLTVQVGDIDSGTGPPPCDVFGFFNLDNFPGYQVQLLAGDVVVGQDDNSLFGVIDDGQFMLSTTVVVIGASHAQLGLPLEIRLVNLNVAEVPGVPGIEVDFDDVQLVAESTCVAIVGDFDSDCDVDLVDYSQLFACTGGPDLPPAVGCPPGVDADFDSDGDVDLVDFITFSLNFTGSGARGVAISFGAVE